jgi:hypothetical protein
MRIREYQSEDLDELRKLHAAQSFGYPFPDLENPLFISKLVLEEDVRDEQGREGNHNSLLPGSLSATSPRIVMAVLQRLTAETYLLHDPAAGTPRDRWQRFLALHDAAQQAAAALGLNDAQAFLPPPVARAVGRRLERLGWVRDPWACYTRAVT